MASWGQTVRLLGDFTDPNSGDTHTFSWVQVATDGPVVNLSSSTSRNLTFTAPSTNTSLTFRFTVRDQEPLSDSADVIVQVTQAGGGGQSLGIN